MASIGVVINVVVMPPSGAATHCRARRGTHTGATLDRPSARQARMSEIDRDILLRIYACVDGKLLNRQVCRMYTKVNY